MMFPTPIAVGQAGFDPCVLRPAYEVAWPDLAAELAAPLLSARAPAGGSAVIANLAARRAHGARPEAAALTVSPRYLLAGGTLCGAQIMPVAPQHDPGPTHGAWLLRAACSEAQAWRAAGARRGALPACVALPRQAVRGAALRAQVRAALAGACLPAGLLDVALPAVELADAGPDVMQLVSALHDLGVGVVLDGLVRLPDGLHSLRRLPLTAVRLAASLTDEVEHCAEARGLVSGAAVLAHSVNTRVAAVDVRTAAQRDILADLGCDEAQGPVFAGCLPPAAFRRALGGVEAGRLVR